MEVNFVNCQNCPTNDTLLDLTFQAQVGGSQSLTFTVSQISSDGEILETENAGALLARYLMDANHAAEIVVSNGVLTSLRFLSDEFSFTFGSSSTSH